MQKIIIGTVPATATLTREDALRLADEYETGGGVEGRLRAEAIRWHLEVVTQPHPIFRVGEDGVVRPAGGTIQ